MADKPRVLGQEEVSEACLALCAAGETADEAEFAAEDEAEALLGLLDRPGGAVGGAAGQAGAMPPGGIGSPAPAPD